MPCNAVRFLMLNWRDPENPLSGGAERVTQGYWSALAQRGHEVFWFSNEFAGGAPEALIDGMHIVRGGGKGTSILRAREWYQRQQRFDLVVDQHHGIPWLAPWWSDTNCISYIHEVLGPIWNAFYPFPWNFLGRHQERWTQWLYRNVLFWTACESTRDDLMRNGVRQVKIIRYGVRTVALSTLDLKPLNLPLRLTMVSRLAPNKRIDHGVRTLAELRKTGLPAELTIIGIGEAEPEIRSVVRNYGVADAVRFTGALAEAEKDELLRRSHLLLHTSQREGWGLNVIEANAMGTPAAVYPVAGLRESTLDNETGVVSRAETPESLATRIRELVSVPDLYARVRTAAWERSKTFHWSQILPPACDWLESLARQR